MPRQKALLSKLLELHRVDNKDFNTKLGQYTRVMQTEEWKFLRDTLLIMKSEMMQELFSKPFTLLPKEEKDITQRTYFQINEVIDFLLQPTTWLKSKRRFTIAEAQRKIKSTVASKRRQYGT